MSRFWQQWLSQHPEQRNVIAQAKILVKVTDFSPVHYNEDAFQATKKNIKNKLFRKQETNVLQSKSKRILVYLLGIAIALGVCLLGVILLISCKPLAIEE
uniref:Uncharacterized protein n=1 Tax=Roseihalotalea indica TaxID=2867963 RepID=A0AA49JFN5_9BACT|nr:hypothetical protein K4G66_25715 [Tunicatimonas sp. TK19036]